MECCRICLTTNDLVNIFETEEIAPNITSITCVHISQDDGLPQYICILCKHELDISVNFKTKCETTFEMLKEQHNKELEVKENIILNLLSSGNAFNDMLPERARRSILNMVKNSVESNIRNIDIATDDHNKEKEYFLDMGQEEFDDQSVDADDQMIVAENQATMAYADDQMTDVTEDITENEYEIPESLGSRNDDLMCLKCNLCFVDVRNLFDHLKRIHPKTMGQCQICMSYFPTSQLLEDHLGSKHDILDDNKNCVNRCKMCNKSFLLQSELNAHLCLLPNGKDFWCELCQLNFKSEADLENHIKYIHQQLEFTCEQCDENFDQFDLYSQHLKQHSEAYRNVNNIELLCSECDKSFMSNEEWNEHIRLWHTKENPTEKVIENLNSISDKNPFVCPLCEKSFKTNNMLKTHIRIHTGEKPFKCVYCQDTFSKSTHLTAHQRYHRGVKPHVCSICQMSFHRKDKLERHLLQHGNLIKCTKEETYISCEVNYEVNNKR